MYFECVSASLFDFHSLLFRLLIVFYKSTSSFDNLDIQILMKLPPAFIVLLQKKLPGDWSVFKSSFCYLFRCTCTLPSLAM